MCGVRRISSKANFVYTSGEPPFNETSGRQPHLDLNPLLLSSRPDDEGSREVVIGRRSW